MVSAVVRWDEMLRERISLSGKLFVIQETVDVLDPVTSWGHIHLCGFAVA
jgi:hypothetical protein